MSLRRMLLGGTIATALLPGGILAQDLRGWAQSSVRYIEMRPLVADTASGDAVVLGSDGVVRVDGRTVRCAPGEECVFYRPAAVTDALVATQDLSFTAWGFGMQGLSFTGLARARRQLSGTFDWPMADDAFDLLVGYAQLDRGPLRVRLGRQQSLSGLGISGFDGALVRFEDGSWWTEGFGGRSLARGLNETRREALRGIDDFIPDQEGWLVGVSGGARLGVTDLSARYQREIIGDRSGLVSERASLDLSTILPSGVRLRSAVDYDVPFGRVGKAHLTLQRALFSGRLLAELEGRRYVPYFELSTIWGFFSPVPYHEVRARASAGFGRWNGVTVAVAARRYGDPSTTVIFRPLEDDGWQADVTGYWAPHERLRLEGGYQLDWAAAAYLHSVDISARWQAGTSVALRMSGTSFQQFEAFRTGDHRALGGGLGMEWNVGSGAHVDGGLTVLRQGAGADGGEDVWNQTRGWIGIRYDFGGDPGLRGRAR